MTRMQKFRNHLTTTVHGQRQGYYDRLLERSRADCALVSLCYESQLFDDILVAVTGSPGITSADHVKLGAAVFDVGVTGVDGKIQGDVQFDAVREVAGYITPMLGGTGPMPVACLMANTVKAALHQVGD